MTERAFDLAMFVHTLNDRYVFLSQCTPSCSVEKPCPNCRALGLLEQKGILEPFLKLVKEYGDTTSSLLDIYIADVLVLDPKVNEWFRSRGIHTFQQMLELSERDITLDKDSIQAIKKELGRLNLSLKA